MTTRITAGAFLTCGNKILLMKRGLHKELGPGLWAGIGGHIDINDITNPRALNLAVTCFREVYEETGIARESIRDLKLRYIATRKVGDEIRFHHHFIGEMETEIPLPKCEEGELHWVCKDDIPRLPMSTSVGEALKHWLANPHSNDVYMVAVDKAGENATVLQL